MDGDLEMIQTHLLDCGLPTSIAELKNPTEEYVFNLVTHFMNAFQIDVSTIKKPTFEQLSTLCVVVEESPEMLTIINLHEAMAAITKLIFLQDFFLSDMTNPTPKRTKKIARFLANFILYANNKMEEIESELQGTRYKLEEINDLREKKNLCLNATIAKALEISKKLALKEQLQIEIEQVKARKEGRKSMMKEVESKLNNVESKKLEASQHYGKLTAEALKMHKNTQDLESKIVRSPRRYEAHLQEVMNQKKQQMEKRETMQEQMRSKKPAIEKIESYLSIVRQVHAGFPEVTEAHKRLTDRKKAMDEAKKKVLKMQSIIEQETIMYNQENEQASDADLEKAKEQCEQRLSTTRKEHSELLNKNKLLEKKLEDSLTQQQQILLETQKIRASIKQRDDENRDFIKQCQEFYDEEIKKERELRVNYATCMREE